YFGRLDPTKGVDLLINAMQLAPAANVLLEVYGVHQPGSDSLAALLKNAAASDPRISMQPTLRPDAVVDAMRACNLVAVPSRWLETGPLVVLESFAAGTPVLGARLGGLAEIVTEGGDGMLVAPDDPAASGSAITGRSGNYGARGNAGWLGAPPGWGAARGGEGGFCGGEGAFLPASACGCRGVILPGRAVVFFWYRVTGPQPTRHLFMPRASWPRLD